MTLKDLTPWNWHKVPTPTANDPFRMLQSRMDRIFNEMFAGSEPAPFGVGSGRGMLAPRIDVTEDDKEYRFTVEIPGVFEKDVEVTISDGELTIKGEKRSENSEEKDKKGNVLRMERKYGAFQRTFSLPADIDDDNVGATFDKGVLTVTVGKSKQAKVKTKKVEIKAA